MEKLRKPFQGLWNVIRFNWHFYVVALGLTISCLLLTRALTPPYKFTAEVLLIFITGSVCVTLFVTWYVYDCSALYQFTWMEHREKSAACRIVNIHAGFDETSGIIRKKYPLADLRVLDFYDPKKHTERSIKRARRAYPPVPGTQPVTTELLPVESNSVDMVFSILSAHEIRTQEERLTFFRELNRVIARSGRLYITEHLRDIPNFLAYNLGFFHFHSRKVWIKTFEQSGFRILEETKTTPFITTFILFKNGTLS